MEEMEDKEEGKEKMEMKGMRKEDGGRNRDGEDDVGRGGRSCVSTHTHRAS